MSRLNNRTLARRAAGVLALLTLIGVATFAASVEIIRDIERRPPALPGPAADRHLGRRARPFRSSCFGPSPSPTGAGACRSTAPTVDPIFIKMLIAYEDRRFFEHDGVDYRALARAAGQFLLAGRIVSGASTLTMQVARLIDGGSDAKCCRQVPPDRLCAGAGKTLQQG